MRLFKASSPNIRVTAQAACCAFLLVLLAAGCGPKKVKAEDLWQLKERVQILELELQRRDREIASIKEALLVLEMSGSAGSMSTIVENPPAVFSEPARFKKSAPKDIETKTPEPVKKTPLKEAAPKTKAAPPNLRATPTNIQTALKKAGYYSGLVDGKNGPKTREAVKAFQKSQKLGADGVVGTKTWQKLSRYLVGPAEITREN